MTRVNCLHAYSCIFRLARSKPPISTHPCAVCPPFSTQPPHFPAHCFCRQALMPLPLCPWRRPCPAGRAARAPEFFPFQGSFPTATGASARPRRALPLAVPALPTHPSQPSACSACQRFWNSHFDRPNDSSVWGLEPKLAASPSWGGPPATFAHTLPPGQPVPPACNNMLTCALVHGHS